MRPFGPDLRERIHRACLDGAGTSEVAARFFVSTAFVRRLRQRYRESNSLAPRKPVVAVRLRLAPYEQVLRQAVRDFPDRTPAEHKQHLGLPASTSTVWRMLGRLGLSRKKKLASPASGSART